MTTPLFRSFDSAAIAADIRAAKISVCYAAPGIQQEPASAIADAAKRIGADLITVCLDFDERVLRMGFGSLAAVKTLRDAGISLNSTIGLRTGLVIVDHRGYIFTPTALYLEAEAPNAMRLSNDQVTEALARLSPGGRASPLHSRKQGTRRAASRNRPSRSPRLPLLKRISRPSSGGWSKRRRSLSTSLGRCASSVPICNMSNLS
jgi:hypothetical protein